MTTRIESLLTRRRGGTGSAGQGALSLGAGRLGDEEKLVRADLA